MIQNAVWSEDEMATIQNRDRLLPSQPYFSKLYRGKDFIGDLEKMLSHPAKNWDIKTKDGLTYACMGSDLNTLHFYQFLIRSHGYKRVLELGTYIGVSAMYLADAGAQVCSVEKGDEFHEIAARNIFENGFRTEIFLFKEDAVEFLINTIMTYDLILIDCAKESYKDLLELSLKKLRKGGMILVDDVFFQGDTLNDAPITEKGAGVRKMLDYAATLQDWERVILPLGNGLLLLRRKI